VIGRDWESGGVRVWEIINGNVRPQQWEHVFRTMNDLSDCYSTKESASSARAGGGR